MKVIVYLDGNMSGRKYHAKGITESEGTLTLKLKSGYEIHFDNSDVIKLEVQV